MTAFNSRGRHEKLAVAVLVLQNTQNLVISRCCFAEDGKEMYKESKRTCRTIVLLIKPFVCWRFSLPSPNVICWNSLLKAGQHANWLAVRVILSTWFDHVVESFSHKEVQFRRRRRRRSSACERPVAFLLKTLMNIPVKSWSCFSGKFCIHGNLGLILKPLTFYVQSAAIELTKVLSTDLYRWTQSSHFVLSGKILWDQSRTGHLTGCTGAHLHNSLTSASSI